MSGIDPARLSRILATLSKPAQARGAAGSVSHTQRASGGTPAKPGVKDPEVLRTRLRSRLKKLQQQSEDFNALAPVITVQEILRWEFGEGVVAHAEFERIADKVAQALLADENVKGAVYRVIENLLLKQVSTLYEKP